MMSSGSSSPWPVGELTDAQAGTQLPSSPSSCHRPPQGSGQLTRGVPSGAIAHPTQQGPSPCSVTCWLGTLVQLPDFSELPFPS